MVDPSFSKALARDFNGAWLLPDATGVPLGKALQSQNMQYAPGQTSSRLGFSTAFSTTDSVTAMFNWISALGNLLFWYRSSDRSVRYLDIDTAVSASTVISGDLIGYSANFAEAGARLFVSFFTSLGIGASGARVITYRGSGFVSDLAFRPPLTYTPPAPTEPGGGTVTAGVHNLGYRIEHRSGFIGRLSPDSGVGSAPTDTSFTPIQFTAAGGKYFSWSLTTTWPIDAVNVYAVMTPVSSPADYRYIPGAVQAVTGGASSTITFIVDLSDDLLVANGEDSNDALFLLTNSVADVPQFYPSQAFTHGNRMVYVTRLANNVGGLSSVILISDIGQYQSLNIRRSIVELPGNRQITTSISLDGQLFIFGPQWVYQTIDNGGDPSSWPTPKLVDGRRGTLAVRGVEVAPSGTYAWVTSQDGLYFFAGVFPALPISYYQQPDWDRINWTAPNAVIVKDDPGVKKVYVMVALDGATTPSHKLTWDYTKGAEPELVQYSIDSLQSYDMGAMELVKNSLPGLPTAVAQGKELWLGSSSTGGILRRNTKSDSNPYVDKGFPVFAVYETALFPFGRSNPGGVLQHHGADYRLTGEGAAQIMAYQLDHARSFSMTDVELSTQPGVVVHRGFDLNSEGVSHLFQQGANLISDPDFEGDATTPADVPVVPPMSNPVRSLSETFTYAGVPLVLTQTPLSGTVPELFWGPLFQENDPANYTISGVTVTLVNAGYSVGDTFTIYYFY